MCLAIPGKVIKINKENAIVDYLGEKRTVDCSLVDCKIGDYVIVQNKFIMQKVPEKEALEQLKLWKKINGC